MSEHTYLGLWVTSDRRIRHELLPNNRYRERACKGRYEMAGTHIRYLDDTGFTADGEFRDGVLHHAGMVLRRE